MTIYSIYVLSKSGGLIYQLDYNIPNIEHEKTFSYPLELVLEVQNRNIVVSYGHRDGIKVGHILITVNGMRVGGTQLEDGRDALEVLKDESNYPVNLKFTRHRLTTNEKIFQLHKYCKVPWFTEECQEARRLRRRAQARLKKNSSTNNKVLFRQARAEARRRFRSAKHACWMYHKFKIPETASEASMFYPLHALASQLSPEHKSSGIEILEADGFKMYCFQTLTGIKFMVICDPKQLGVDALLKSIYELYSDFALKNPFYSLEMPIRCELFDENIKSMLEQVEKSGVSNI